MRKLGFKKISRAKETSSCHGVKIIVNFPCLLKSRMALTRFTITQKWSLNKRSILRSFNALLTLQIDKDKMLNSQFTTFLLCLYVLMQYHINPINVRTLSKDYLCNESCSYVTQHTVISFFSRNLRSFKYQKITSHSLKILEQQKKVIISQSYDDMIFYHK